MFDRLESAFQDARECSRELFTGSREPLRNESSLSLEDFCNSFCEARVRWETLGIFFTVVSRATIDITHFEDLFISQQQRQKIRMLGTHFSDCCLNLALSLDCLNDLQLFLQYETFINHSIVNGDQSESITNVSLP